jgi:hypothetical protein
MRIFCNNVTRITAESSINEFIVILIDVDYSQPISRLNAPDRSYALKQVQEAREPIPRLRAALLPQQFLVFEQNLAGDDKLEFSMAKGKIDLVIRPLTRHRLK